MALGIFTFGFLVSDNVRIGEFSYQVHQKPHKQGQHINRGYRPLDVLPDDTIQHGVAGSHHNIFIAQQNPNNCQCFWRKQKYVLKPGELPLNAIPIEPFIN